MNILKTISAKYDRLVNSLKLSEKPLTESKFYDIIDLGRVRFTKTPPFVFLPQIDLRFFYLRQLRGRNIIRDISEDFVNVKILFFFCR